LGESALSSERERTSMTEGTKGEKWQRERERRESLGINGMGTGTREDGSGGEKLECN
jgi:hypothetical protein